MPRTLTQYRVFIGSPGGLREERERFRDVLEKFTRLHSEPGSVTFFPVGWEDTIGGVGRPQALINEDLRQCDYAVFVLHDRWGTPTGNGHTSGTEEEWELAEKLYKKTKLRNISLFFKKIDDRQLIDPGDQLKNVLKFKHKIEIEKRYLFKSYVNIDEFCESIEGNLAKWFRDHSGDKGSPEAIGPTTFSPLSSATDRTADASEEQRPNFGYWIAEADRLYEAEDIEYSSVLFCAQKALEVASSDVDWAEASDRIGGAQLHLNKLVDRL
jgi:hypothetical protein